MTVSFPPQIKQFVNQQLAEGAYRCEEDLVLDAVKVLRELKLRHQQLRRDIQHAITQFECGEGEPLDMASIKAKARKRLVGRGKGR